MDEINPNHPVTRTLHDHWHKLLAVVLHKYRHDLPRDVVITGPDIEALTRAYPEMPSIIAHDQRDGLHLRLVDGPEGERLARKEGGLPS